MRQRTPGLQDVAFCWTVRVSGVWCPLQSQLKRGPRAWIPHPQLQHLKVRSPGMSSHEQATRVESETGSIRSQPHVLGGSDTESIAGISEQGDGVEVVDATRAEAPVDFAPRTTQKSEGLACLDGVSLRDVFDTRAVVMHSVPFFLPGAFRGALKVFLQVALSLVVVQTSERR